MTRDSTGLADSFRRAGQGHVFAFIDRLAPDSRARLMSDAAEVDLAEVDRLVRTLVLRGAAPAADLEGLAPAPYERLPSHGGDGAAWRAARRRARPRCARAASPRSPSRAAREHASATTARRARFP